MYSYIEETSFTVTQTQKIVLRHQLIQTQTMIIEVFYHDLNILFFDGGREILQDIRKPAVAKFLVPDGGDMVDSGIYRVVVPGRQAT